MGRYWKEGREWGKGEERDKLEEAREGGIEEEKGEESGNFV